MTNSRFPGSPSKFPARPNSSQFPAAERELPTDTGAQMLMGGKVYYRQLEDLAIHLCVAKTISDAEWLEFLEGSLHAARKIRRMPKATIATFVGTYPDAKQRRQTSDFLAEHKIKPIERLGLLSDNPLLRGAIVAFSWVVPNANVLAFGSGDVAKCLTWLHETTAFDEQLALTVWNEGKVALRTR